jgi:hypothetical protein
MKYAEEMMRPTQTLRWAMLYVLQHVFRLGAMKGANQGPPDT